MFSTAGEYNGYPQSDPTDYLWNGSQTGAFDAFNNARNAASAASQRTAGPQNTAQQMGDYDNYLQSRRMQGQQLAQYAAIMRGAPTAAQRQVQAGTQQAAAAQQGIASSYRGQGAGIAAAHMAALYGGAQARAVGSQNLALQQQQDQIAATQGYSGLANQLRQSDLARQGMSQDQAYRVAQMQGQNNAQNDAMEQYYAQQGFNVENQQLQAAGQYESQDAYNKLGSAGLLAQQDAFNRQQNSQNIAGYLSAFGALAAAAA